MALRGDLRQMRHAQHLSALAELAQLAADDLGHRAADAGVDLVEHHAAALHRPRRHTCTASDRRESSPPEATFAIARGGWPGLVLTRNSTRSRPCAAGSAFSAGATSIRKRPPAMPSSCMRAEISLASARAAVARRAES